MAKPRKIKRSVEIRNAARPLRINITEGDIRKGKRLNPDACAAAQCILRSTKAEAVHVHRGVTYLKFGKQWTRYATSSGLRLETIIFDRGGRFIPGEYDLVPVPLGSLTRAKPKSQSKGKTPREAKLATRRLVIPGVRHGARLSALSGNEEK